MNPAFDWPRKRFPRPRKIACSDVAGSAIYPDLSYGISHPANPRAMSSPIHGQYTTNAPGVLTSRVGPVPGPTSPSREGDKEVDNNTRVVKNVTGASLWPSSAKYATGELVRCKPSRLS